MIRLQLFPIKLSIRFYLQLYPLLYSNKIHLSQDYNSVVFDQRLKKHSFVLAFHSSIEKDFRYITRSLKLQL